MTRIGLEQVQHRKVELRSLPILGGITMAQFHKAGTASLLDIKGLRILDFPGFGTAQKVIAKRNSDPTTTLMAVSLNV